MESKGFTIVSGDWVKGSNNFTGYSKKGEVDRLFIPLKAMESAGFVAGDKVKFPFECMAIEKEFQPALRDASGERVPDGKGGFKLASNEDGTPKLVKRVQATAVFKSMAEKSRIWAESKEELFDAMVKKEVAKIAKAEGLTLADLGIVELENVSTEIASN